MDVIETIRGLIEPSSGMLNGGGNRHGCGVVVNGEEGGGRSTLLSFCAIPHEGKGEDIGPADPRVQKCEIDVEQKASSMYARQ